MKNYQSGTSVRYLVPVLFILGFCLNPELRAHDNPLMEALPDATFGIVEVVKPAGTISSVIILVSGEEGWDRQMAYLAKYSARLGALVIGIDFHHYMLRLKKQSVSCYYPAGDFETLSLRLQKKYKLRQYFKPILVSYSRGSAIIYGALAQAPANTFKGAIALGFCPEIESNKPLCGGSGLKYNHIKERQSYALEPSENLTAPFIVFQGLADIICSDHQAAQFIKDINMGQIVEIPHAGATLADTTDWHAQYKNAYKTIQSAPTFAEQKAAQNKLLQSQHLIKLPGDFPATLIPAQANDTLPMVFLISGDGGWTSFDHDIGESLAGKGMPVVGLDAQKYFWNFKSPDESASDISTAVEYYMQQWHKRKFLLVGYSFGACIVPFIAGKFSAALKSRLQGIYSLSPDETADFEIHLTDMFSVGNSNDTYDVIQEMKNIKNLHPVCIFGDEEDAESRKHFGETGAEIYTVPGSHHYNNNPDMVATVILKDAEKISKKK
jgi:type IV secretory pathway VirJ component